MASRSFAALVCCVLAFAAATEAARHHKATPLDRLPKESPKQIAATLAKCKEQKRRTGETCLALEVYLATCRAVHGPHVLTCVPRTGHHTHGVATSCVSPQYRLVDPRGKNACQPVHHKKTHPKPHTKPHAKPHSKPHAKPHSKPHSKPHTPHPVPTPTSTPHAAPTPSPPPVVLASPPPPPQQKHIILLSIDGMHAADLAYYTALRPGSNFSMLAAAGTLYPSASTSFPSDSFPGVLAMTTAGTAKSTGIYYDDTYARELYAPGNVNCTGAPGTEFAITEALEYNLNYVDGVNGTTGYQTVSQQKKALNPANLPRMKNAVTGTCDLVYPNERVRVNTIFDVVKAAGGYTAWADKGFEYQMLQAKSGNGILDLYTPEIKAANNGYDTNKPPTILQYDTLHTQAILGWISGVNTAGQKIPVPWIMGGDFQSVSVSQKVPGYGYTPSANGPIPTAGLITAFDFMDGQIGQIVAALKAAGLYTSTTIFITAKHGQSPRDPTMLVTEKSPNGYGSSPTPVLDPAKYITSLFPTEPAFANGDDGDLIWLNNQTNYLAVAQALQANATALGIQSLLYLGHGLETTFANPLVDIRTPDIIVISKPGVIYTTSTKKIAEHGGDATDDRNVPLLAYGPNFAAGATIATPVQTTQIPVSILDILGLDHKQLQAQVLEQTPPLPGVSGTTPLSG